MAVLGETIEKPVDRRLNTENSAKALWAKIIRNDTSLNWFHLTSKQKLVNAMTDQHKVRALKTKSMADNINRVEAVVADMAYIVQDASSRTGSESSSKVSNQRHRSCGICHSTHSRNVGERIDYDRVRQIIPTAWHKLREQWPRHLLRNVLESIGIGLRYQSLKGTSHKRPKDYPELKVIRPVKDHYTEALNLCTYRLVNVQRWYKK